MSGTANSKRARWLLAGIILVAFAWRVHNLDRQSLWRDEIDAIYFALRDLPATLSMFVDTGQNGALYFLALRPWLSLLGSSGFALRFTSVIFGVLSIPLLWQVCRKVVTANPIGSREQGKAVTRPGQSHRGRSTWASAPLIAAVLLAMNPYHLWYSQEGKMYALIIFLSLLAIWFWLSGIERGGFRPWLGFWLTVTLAIYSHLLMILLIPLFIIWFVIAWPKSKRHYRGFLLALAGLTLPYLPLLVWQWDLLTSKEILTALEFVPLRQILTTLLVYHSSSFITVRNSLYLVPLAAITLAGVSTALRGSSGGNGPTTDALSQRRRMFLVLAWLSAPVASIYLLSLRQPVFLPRYVIWIAPAAMILLALGIQSIGTGSGRLSGALALSLMLYVIAYWGVIGWQETQQEIKTDLRGTVSYLAEQREADELLIIQIPNLHVAYQYYSSDQGSRPFTNGQSRLGWWAAGLSPPADLGEEEARNQVDNQMRRLTFAATDIWVMLSEAYLADPDRLMVEWLDAEASLVDQADFRGAQVRKYRMNAPVVSAEMLAVMEAAASRAPEP